MRKSLRPSNRVTAGDNAPAQVLRVSRRKQGGAWVRVYLVRYENTGAERVVACRFIRPANLM